MAPATHDNEGPTMLDRGGSIIPILPVRSLDRAQQVTEAFGLEVERYDDGYAWVRADGHEVWHLRVVEDLDPASNPTGVYVFVGDPDDVHARLTDAGLEPSDVEATPWGMRELRVRDPDGNLFRFGCTA